MAVQSLHEVNFEWPHPEPTSVIVTGTFDEWSCSVPLTKIPTGYVGSTKIPWGEKIKFKYVVDGKWLLHENQATETDPGGFVNHVYTAPPAPSPAPEEPSTNSSPEPTADSAVQDEVSKDTANGSGNWVTAVEGINEPASKAESEAEISATTNTLAATDGTTSAIDYVASGLGVVIHNVVGVDPINSQPIAIPTPATASSFTLPGEQNASVNANSAAESSEANPDKSIEKPVESPPSSPIAPIVPLFIVPVNAAENNTVPSSSSHQLNASAPPFIPGATRIIVGDASDKAVPKDGDAAPDTTVSEEITPSGPGAVALVEESTPLADAVTVDVINVEEPASVTVTQESAAEVSAVEVLLVNDAPVADEKGANEELKDDKDISNSAPALKDATIISVVEEVRQPPADNVVAEEVKPSVEDALDAATSAVAEHNEPETPAAEASVVDEVPVAIISVASDEAVPSKPSDKIDTDTPANPLVENLTDAAAILPVTSSTEESLLAPVVSEIVVAETVEEPNADAQPDGSTAAKLPEVLIPAEPIEDAAVEHPASSNEVTTLEKEVKTELNTAPIIPTAEPASQATAEPTLYVPVTSDDVTPPAPAEDVVTPAEIVVPAEILGLVSKPPDVEPVQSAAITLLTHADDSKPKDIVATTDSALEAGRSTPANGITPEVQPESAESLPVQSLALEDHQTAAPRTEDKPTAATTVSPDALPEQPAERTSVEAPAISTKGVPAPQKGGEPSSNGDSAKEATPAPPSVEAFPSTSTATDSSPPSSKTNTMRKKRTSIFGKLKNIFHSDKDKEKK